MKSLVSKRMTVLRLREGLTQKELAQKIGLSRPHIGNFEIGQYEPSEDVIQDYCQFFQVPAEYFKDCPSCTKRAAFLKRLFHHLLHEEISECDRLMVSCRNSFLNLEQEISMYILKSAYHYAKRESGEAQKIEEFFVTAFQIGNNVDDLSVLSKKYWLLYQAEKSYYFGNYDEAILHWNALSLLVVEPDDTIRISFRRIACHFRKQDYVKVYSLTKLLVSELETLKRPNLLAKAYALLSSAYGQLNMFQESLAVLDKLEAHIDCYELTSEKIILYGNRGYIYSSCGQLSEALVNYQKTLTYANTPERLANAYNSNISILIDLGQYEIALIYVKEMQSLNLSEREKMVALSYEAEILLYQGYEKESWKMQKTALDYFIENNLPHNASYIYSQLAAYYLEKKMFKKAAIYMQRKEDITREKNKILLA